MKVVLTIAGSDITGGSGVQGDIKTILRNGCYGVSAVTALTAKNTVQTFNVCNVTPEFLADQLDAVFSDFTPDAVKVGMSSCAELVHVIAEKLKEYGAKNIVVDPVIPAKGKVKIVDKEAIEVLEKELLPLADVITPDVEEARMLSGIMIETETDLINASKLLSEKYGCTIVSKGHFEAKNTNDLLFRDGYYKWFWGKSLTNPNNHGAGNSLSSALACNLAKGYDMDKAYKRAKDFVTEALDDELDLGAGCGPINHGFNMDDDYIKVLSDEEISRA